jgi:hypothetical protein
MAHAKDAPSPILVDDDDSLADIGDFVLYTDAKGAHRCAVVMFILQDDTDSRPVLRVFVPAAPTLGGMPTQGIVHPVSHRDYEVYGPKFSSDVEDLNTWRHRHMVE